MSEPTRRQVLSGLAGSAALGLLAGHGVGCGATAREPTTPPDGGRTTAFREVDAVGSYRELGRSLGEAASETLRFIAENDPAYARLQEAAGGAERDRVARFLEATTSRFPHLVEEVEGMAEGAGLELNELFTWISRAELGVAIDPCPPGCSTIAYVGNGGMILAHNEDGSELYHGRMLLMRATPPSGISFAALVYPGTIPGNGPGVNSRGIAQSTNYISMCQPVDTGIPRYFLGRAVLEAESLEQAVELATTDGRAFPWHHNLASLPDARLISLETWPGRDHATEVAGVHLHTNNLLHEEMQGLNERAGYLETSSRPRLAALRRYVESREVSSGEELLGALRDRSGAPCHVCRRPGDEVPGVTVATAIFQAPRVEMTLVEGPPCDGGPETTFSPPSTT